MPAAQKNAGGEREAPPELELAPGVRASAGLCARLKRENTIVAADAHLGFEAVAAGDGAYFPRRQKAIILARLKSILDRYRPELFVVAGDVNDRLAAPPAKLRTFCGMCVRSPIWL